MESVDRHSDRHTEKQQGCLPLAGPAPKDHLRWTLFNWTDGCFSWLVPRLFHTSVVSAVQVLHPPHSPTPRVIVSFLPRCSSEEKR